MKPTALLLSLDRSLSALRILIGVDLAAHGTIRLLLGGVGGFGGFLGKHGFPLGEPLAWLITLIEVLGGLGFALGWAVPYLGAWFIFELIMGIVLVHASIGWFTVGAMLGGMEFSTILILSFFVVICHSWEKARGARPPAARE